MNIERGTVGVGHASQLVIRKRGLDAVGSVRVRAETSRLRHEPRVLVDLPIDGEEREGRSSGVGVPGLLQRAILIAILDTIGFAGRSLSARVRGSAGVLPAEVPLGLDVSVAVVCEDGEQIGSVGR